MGFLETQNLRANGDVLSEQGIGFGILIQAIVDGVDRRQSILIREGVVKPRGSEILPDSIQRKVSPFGESRTVLRLCDSRRLYHGVGLRCQRKSKGLCDLRTF